MADAKISQLPVATTPLAGTELVPLVQGGVTVQSTVDKVLTGTVPSGTANGVLFLNGSKVVTSGSALTFDGTNLGVGTTNPGAFGLLAINGASASANINASTGSAALKFYEGSGTGRGSISSLNGSDGLAFLQGTTEAMRLTSTGLGIGTSSPNYPLHINGSPQIQFTNPSTGTTTGDGSHIYLSTSNLWVVNKEAADINFATDNSLRMTLDSSGNLGLGVTPDAWSAIVAFQVGNGASLHGFGVDEATLSGNTYYNGGYKYAASSFATQYQQQSGLHKWYTAPSGTAGNAISFSQALTLDANRNLALNTTSVGTSAAGVLSVGSGTEPSSGPADTVQFYSVDRSAGNTIPAIYCEGSGVTNAGITNVTVTNKIAIKINGTVYYLLATTDAT